MLSKVILVVLALLVLAVLYLRFGAERISGAQARALVEGGALLVDVRSPAEFSEGHIEGAVSIPIQELSERTDELGDPGREIIVYCASGGRSAMARRLLQNKGFEGVHDLGGMSRW